MARKDEGQENYEKSMEKKVLKEKGLKGGKDHKAKEARAMMKSIVRISGKDLNGELPVYRALTALKGIGDRLGKVFAIAFEQKTKIPFDSKLSALSEQNVAVLEDLIINPAKYNVPSWCLNHRKEYVTGMDKHLIMSDLDFDLRNTLKRLGEIRSYRGLRHAWGLPVRGQRTKSTHRGKGGTVGVLKKDIAQAAAPKKDDKGAK